MAPLDKHSTDGYRDMLLLRLLTPSWKVVTTNPTLPHHILHIQTRDVDPADHNPGLLLHHVQGGDVEADLGDFAVFHSET